MSKEKEPLTWETIQVRLGDLIPNPENPKYSTEATAKRLNDSIDTLGDFQNLVVDVDGLSAIDGHQRINAWIAHKGESFEIHARKPNRKLTKQEVKKLILYSGKGTHGEFDFDMMALNFDMTEAVEFGGFDPLVLSNAYGVDLGDYEPPDSKEIDENDLETDNTCPKCGFEY